MPTDSKMNLSPAKAEPISNCGSWDNIKEEKIMQQLLLEKGERKKECEHIRQTATSQQMNAQRMMETNADMDFWPELWLYGERSPS